MPEHRTDDQHDTFRGSDDVRTALIEATLTMLDRIPPSQLTVRAIAAEAGVNHGLVHRHFGSKAALLGAAYERHTAQHATPIDPDTDLLEQLFAPFEFTVTSSVQGKVVAWAASEGIEPGELDLQYPRLRRSAALLADRHPDATSLVSFFTAAAIGWSAIARDL